MRHKISWYLEIPQTCFRFYIILLDFTYYIRFYILSVRARLSTYFTKTQQISLNNYVPHLKEFLCLFGPPSLQSSEGLSMRSRPLEVTIDVLKEPRWFRLCKLVLGEDAKTTAHLKSAHITKAITQILHCINVLTLIIWFIYSLIVFK